MTDKRYIEESFPVKEVSAESSKEKSIRHGHISTLHIWWARRPLASSRTTIYASLIPAPENEEERKRIEKDIITLSKWENSLNAEVIKKARGTILKANNGKEPRILDPFAGGGAIPLEALRLGCETYAGEYNPVAVLILKCTLEYPQKYGRPSKEKWGDIKGTSRNPLLEDVKKWGEWVLEETKKEIGKFYPEEEDGSIPVGYIWARTIPCQNPSCGAEIPLMRQFWLAKREKRKIALKPSVKNGKVEFEVVNIPLDWKCKKRSCDCEYCRGTVKGAIVKCPVCGSTIDAKNTRKLFQERKSGQKMVAVVLHHPKMKGKIYRVAVDKDWEIFNEARKYLEEKEAELIQRYGIDPIPQESLPPKKTLGFRVQRYGITKWGKLFNSRQGLALITFVEGLGRAYEKMLKEGIEKEYAKVLESYLAIILDRLADKNSNLVVYHIRGEKIEHVFGRQALGMVWDYAEVNPFTDVGWPNMQKWVERIIDHISRIPGSELEVAQYSATSLPCPNSHFDAVITDPPYYDNVPYSYLSDFFYVWLKRCVGDFYPDLFSTPLTPKSKEIVAYTYDRTWEEAKKYFESKLGESFREIHRVLRPNGIATIVYAHKTTEGWETVINALLDSGLVITASWPINTEMQTRLRARGSAALASSIYIVARKMERKETGWFDEIKREIKEYLNEKMERLWSEGISGTDYFIAAIGSAIEIFGKYEKVMDYQGNTVRADKLLDFVRSEVTDYVVRQILHNGIAGELSALTKFYILWRWTFQEKIIQFDEARKLAQSTGIDLAREWNKGFIRKDREFIEVLGPHKRDIKSFEKSDDLIDVLHHALVLYRDGRREELTKLLQESKWGKEDSFYRVAQAISETLPSQSREKTLLETFLQEKQRLIREVKIKDVQTRLFE